MSLASAQHQSGATKATAAGVNRVSYIYVSVVVERDKPPSISQAHVTSRHDAPQCWPLRSRSWKSRGGCRPLGCRTVCSECLPSDRSVNNSKAASIGQVEDQVNCLRPILSPSCRDLDLFETLTPHATHDLYLPVAHQHGPNPRFSRTFVLIAFTGPFPREIDTVCWILVHIIDVSARR